MLWGNVRCYDNVLFPTHPFKLAQTVSCELLLQFSISAELSCLCKSQSAPIKIHKTANRAQAYTLTENINQIAQLEDKKKPNKCWGVDKN